MNLKREQCINTHVRKCTALPLCTYSSSRWLCTVIVLKCRCFPERGPYLHAHYREGRKGEGGGGAREGDITSSAIRQSLASLECDRCANVYLFLLLLLLPPQRTEPLHYRPHINSQARFFLTVAFQNVNHKRE